MQTLAALPDNPVRQWRQCADGTWVNRSAIIGLDIVTYHAYVEIAMWLGHSHSSITHVDPADRGHEWGMFPREMWLGQLGTEALEPGLDLLPAMSEIRFRRVTEYQAKNRLNARLRICEAFPEATQVLLDDGYDQSSMELWVPGVAHLARIENYRTCLKLPGYVLLSQSCATCGTYLGSSTKSCEPCCALTRLGKMPPFTQERATLQM